jgi:23S rRNA (cytosine1962-C5)-methyltransferase
LPAAPIEVREGELQFGVELRTGQKTGFYLDQRINRLRAASYAAGRSSRTSAPIPGLLRRRAARGRCSLGGRGRVGAGARARGRQRGAERGTRLETVRANAFDWLAAQAHEGRTYGMIVLDPPRFARSRRGLPSALEGYRRLNALALACLAEGGVLVTFSCSGRVSEADFQGRWRERRRRRDGRSAFWSGWRRPPIIRYRPPARRPHT